MNMTTTTSSRVCIASSSWVSAPDERSVLFAPLLTGLSVRHGFTTRLDGYSCGRFASLNVGAAWGDDPEMVARNLTRVSQIGGFAQDKLCLVRQVHGTSVVYVSQPERGLRQADGLATDVPLCLGVLSADCVSVLLADGEGRVAATHSGWRGTVSGIAGQAVRTLTKLGASVKKLRAVLGPSIGPCCFQVKTDVASLFAAQKPKTVLTQDDRTYVDLHLFLRETLLDAGLLPEHVGTDPPCTACDSKRFFSFRRDGGGIGQHLAFVVGGTP